MIQKTKKIIGFILFFISFNVLADEIVNDIKIQGNQRIADSTIISYLDFNKGEVFTEDKYDISLKNLFATDFFSHIDIKFDKSVVKIKVKENPIINKVIFEGNNKIKSQDLESNIILAPRTNYTRAKLQEDINKIIEIYGAQSRFAVKVVPKIVEHQHNSIDLIFEITEGNIAKISKIAFVGNKNFTSSKLSSVIASKKTRLLSFLSNDDKYNQYKLNYDKELLSSFYRDHGFINFKVISSSSEITEDKEKILITFVVEEGEQYKIGKINFRNPLKKINDIDLHKQLNLKSGQVYNQSKIDENINKINNWFKKQGHLFIEIKPIYKNNDKKLAVDINFDIIQGKKYYINRINIKGNSKTRDNVIRREFDVHEGDPLNISDVNNTQKRLNNLDFFEQVAINKLAADVDDKVNLDVFVTDKTTTHLNFAGGYDTSSGPVGKIGFTESNLFGQGKQLAIELSKAPSKLDIDLSYTEPYFMNYPITAGVDLFKASHKKNTRNSINFSSDVLGASLRMGYQLHNNLTHHLKYNLSRREISDSKEVNVELLGVQNGKDTLSSISHKLIYDTRNYRMDPTEGVLGVLKQEYAGLGGTLNYIKSEVMANYFMPIYKDDVVLELNAKIGHIHGFNNKQIKRNDKFYLGGDSPRGFEFAGIGPRAKAIKEACNVLPLTAQCNLNPYIDDVEDKNYNSGEALGGKIYYSTTAEVRFPLPFIKEYGLFSTAFVEAGNVINADINDIYKDRYHHESKIRASAGVAFGFQSPMGPIKINYALPISKTKFDKTMHLYVSFVTSQF